MSIIEDAALLYMIMCCWVWIFHSSFIARVSVPLFIVFQPQDVLSKNPNCFQWNLDLLNLTTIRWISSQSRQSRTASVQPGALMFKKWRKAPRALSRKAPCKRRTWWSKTPLMYHWPMIAHHKSKCNGLRPVTMISAHIIII